MPNKLELHGFDDLRAELRALPDTLNREAGPILLRFARAAQSRIVAAYPSITGTLRAGVDVVARAARGVASLYTLRSNAWYSHIYEFGSFRQRPRPTFIPIENEARRDAVIAVADMVERQGLVVRGARD